MYRHDVLCMNSWSWLSCFWYKGQHKSYNVNTWILLVKFSFTEKEQMYGATLLGHYWIILSGLLDIQNDLDSFTLTTRMVRSDMWRTQQGGTHNSSTRHMEAQDFEHLSSPTRAGKLVINDFNTVADFNSHQYAHHPRWWLVCSIYPLGENNLRFLEYVLSHVAGRMTWVDWKTRTSKALWSSKLDKC